MQPAAYVISLMEGYSSVFSSVYSVSSMIYLFRILESEFPISIFPEFCKKKKKIEEDVIRERDTGTSNGAYESGREEISRRDQKNN